MPATTPTPPTSAGPDRAIEIPGLHPATPQELSFAPGTVARAFLLEREHGNVLIYDNGALASDLDAWRSLGGASRQYLGHWHEAMFGDAATAAELGAPLFVHAADASEVTARGRAVRAAFRRRHTLDDDLEVIPIPGHTPGSTAYLWRTGERRALFTADTLYLHGDEWVAAVLGSSDRDSYVASLELLRDVEFDLLVPWAASADGPYAVAVDPDERRERLDAVIARLRRGESR